MSSKKNFEEINSQLSENFNQLSKKEKIVYQTLANKERNKYEIDFLLIKKYLFLNFNDFAANKLIAFELYKLMN